MQLKLKRTQKTSGMMSKSVVFCLDARVELTPEEAENVRKYKLGSQVIYNSEASKRHLENAAYGLGSGTGGGVLRRAISTAMAKMQLNITVDGLVRGQHVECKDLDELLGAEEAIVQACQAIKGYLDVSATFDGQETVIDFDEEVRAA